MTSLVNNVVAFS